MKKSLLVISMMIALAIALGGCATKGDLEDVQAREKAIGGKIYTFEEGLAKYGLAPENIDVVIHTHLHNDHCENDFKCTNAVIYTHEKEKSNFSLQRRFGHFRNLKMVN